MVNIVYRHYRDGESKACAELFTRAFQANIFSHIDNEERWHWRYPLDPDFEPEMIQIAEDTDNNRLVGMIAANRVEKIIFNGVEYLIGDINDVGTDPRYTRRGISKKLMSMAMDYFDSRGCDYSMLCAEPKGFPRENIYLKFGYVDVGKQCMAIGYPHAFKIIKDTPILTMTFPILTAINYLPRYLNRVRLKFNSLFKDFSYEIHQNRRHWEVMGAINGILPRNYAGFYPYDKRKYRWMRINVPYRDIEPTYILIKKNGNIIGGGTLTSMSYISLKLKFGIFFSVLHEVFLDKSIFATKRDLHFGYIYLLDKILKGASKRNHGLLVYFCTSTDINLRRALYSLGIVQVPAATIMIKPLKSNLKVPKFNKPLYCPTYVSIGDP
jgi:GNAT superfamily N-acetyltransferase